MQDRTWLEYNVTWIPVTKKFNMNVNTVTQMILQQTVNKSKMQQMKQTTDKRWVSNSQVSETRNTTGTWLSKQVSNHCSSGLQVLCRFIDCFCIAASGTHGNCGGNFVPRQAVHYLPSSQTNGRLPYLCCHKCPQYHLIHTKAKVYKASCQPPFRKMPCSWSCSSVTVVVPCPWFSWCILCFLFFFLHQSFHICFLHLPVA